MNISTQPLTPSLKYVLARAKRIARERGDNFLSTFHIVAAIAQNPNGELSKLLRSNGLSFEKILAMPDKRPANHNESSDECG